MLRLLQSKKEPFFFFTEKALFKEKGDWKSEQKMKRKLFNCSRNDY